MNYDQLIPAWIRALGGYAAGKPIKTALRESGGTAMIKMASNENPFGPSPRALTAMQAAAADVYLYPDMEVTELRTRLAALHGVPPQQVLVTSGSTQFLMLLGRALLQPGLNAVTSERSFIVYPLATRATGAEFRAVPMKNDAFDLDAVLAAIDDNTRLVFLANPNNPTGTLFDAEATDRFLERVPAHVTVILDEAYCDFAEFFAARKGIRYSHSMDYVRAGRNVVVLRTFSKAQGLAGIRVGYGLGPEELLHFCNRIKTPFSVSAMAEAAAVASLEDGEHVRRCVENNAAGAAFLLKSLREMGYQPVETFANFIYVDVGEDSAAVARRMEAEGIIIRPLKPWGAPSAIRVTIGTPEQNELFVRALRKVMEKAAVR